MIHPLLLAVLCLDCLALLFYLGLAPSATRVLLQWQPGSAQRRQIELEGARDGASSRAAYATGFFVLSSLLLVLAISMVLPALTAGAMCGTGVLQAMDGAGGMALALRCAALLVLWAGRTVERLHHGEPRPLDEQAVARWQLLALPLLCIAVLGTLRALWQLDPAQPVDCCQLIYGDLGSAGAGGGMLQDLPDDLRLQLEGLGLFCLALLGLLLSRRGREASEAGRWALPGFILALLLVPLAASNLADLHAAYHYGVLQHHCPWCLFLPQHHCVGLLHYGALLVIALESVAALAAVRFGSSHPSLSEGAASRRQRAGRWLIAASLLYLASTWGPALLWRWEHGVWIR